MIFLAARAKKYSLERINNFSIYTCKQGVVEIMKYQTVYFVKQSGDDSPGADAGIVREN